MLGARAAEYLGLAPEEEVPFSIGPMRLALAFSAWSGLLGGCAEWQEPCASKRVGLAKSMQLGRLSRVGVVIFGIFVGLAICRYGQPCPVQECMALGNCPRAIALGCEGCEFQEGGFPKRAMNAPAA